MHWISAPTSGTRIDCEDDEAGGATGEAGGIESRKVSAGDECRSLSGRARASPCSTTCGSVADWLLMGIVARTRAVRGCTRRQSCSCVGTPGGEYSKLGCGGAGLFPPAKRVEFFWKRLRSRDTLLRVATWPNARHHYPLVITTHWRPFLSVSSSRDKIR